MATALGDRVERAIERRTETTEELAVAAPPPRRLRRTVFWLAVTGVSLYLVFPSVVKVAGSWRDITRFAVGSLVAMAALQAGTLACLWALQKLALRAPRWRPVITSQLAGNALAKIAPGGGAMGGALQYRMLVAAGRPPASTVTALTAVNLLAFAVLLAMPVLAIPALLGGGVDRGLVRTAVVGVAVFVVASAIGAVLMTTDRPLSGRGSAVQRVRNRLRRGSRPLEELPRRLLRERD